MFKFCLNIFRYFMQNYENYSKLAKVFARYVQINNKYAYM